MGHYVKNKPISYLGKYKKIIPNGVSQGGLGDCWFLSSCSTLAEADGGKRLLKIMG
jgi:hypothetical protein